MSDLLNPANLIVLAVIAIGMFFGLRRIAASTRGKELLQRWCGRKENKEGRGDRYRCVALSL